MRIIFKANLTLILISLADIKEGNVGSPLPTETSVTGPDRKVL